MATLQCVLLSLRAGDRDLVLSRDGPVFQVSEFLAGNRASRVSRVRTNSEAGARETLFAMARERGSTWPVLCGPVPKMPEAFDRRVDAILKAAGVNHG